MSHKTENSFLLKLEELGQKMGQNKYLGAIQGAMMGLMGIIMIGAAFMIVNSVGGEMMLGFIPEGSALQQALNIPYMYTMNLLGVWLVLLLAYHYAKNLEIESPVMQSVNSLVVYLLLVAPAINTDTATGIDTAFLGAPGMFIGFITVFIVVQIEKICKDKNLRINLSDNVPQYLQDSFSSMIPLLISITLALLLQVSIASVTRGQFTVATGFNALIATPLQALTSVPGMFVIGLIVAVLWALGIHGTMIIGPMLMPLIIEAAVTNGEAYAAGEPLTFFPVLLFGAINSGGGTGNTFGLTIFGSFAKSDRIRTISRTSAIPGWFGINEPVLFGMPIIHNPIMAIPFVLAILISMLISYISYQTGFIIPSFIAITAQLPIGFAGYFGSLNIGNLILPYIQTVIAALIYLPFLRAYDKQLYQQEQEAKLSEETI